MSLSLFFVLEMRMYWLKFQQPYSEHEDKEDTLRMIEQKFKFLVKQKPEFLVISQSNHVGLPD